MSLGIGRYEFNQAVEREGTAAFQLEIWKNGFSWERFSEQAAGALDRAIAETEKFGKLDDTERAEAAVRYWLASMGQEVPF